jgi:predicted nucleic acid-binding protein
MQSFVFYLESKRLVFQISAFRRKLPSKLPSHAFQKPGLTDAIALRAIELLRGRKMGLADAVIAATALQHCCPLVTRNVDDFKNIPGLVVIDPFCRV